jgi:TctA family transporter
MALSDARIAFNRLLFSLAVIIIGMFAFTFFMNAPTTETRPFTGQFVLNQTIFFVVLVVGLLTVGVILLKTSVSR